MERGTPSLPPEIKEGELDSSRPPSPLQVPGAINLVFKGDWKSIYC